MDNCLVVDQGTPWTQLETDPLPCLVLIPTIKNPIKAIVLPLPLYKNVGGKKKKHGVGCPHVPEL